MPVTWHGRYPDSESWGETLGKSTGRTSGTLLDFYYRQRLLRDKFEQDQEAARQKLFDKLLEEQAKKPAKEKLTDIIAEYGAASRQGDVAASKLYDIGYIEAVAKRPEKEMEAEVSTKRVARETELKRSIEQPYSYKKWQEGKLAMDAADKYFAEGDTEKGWTSYRLADNLFKEAQLHGEAEVEKARKQKQAELEVARPFEIEKEERQRKAEELKEEKLKPEKKIAVHKGEIEEIEKYHASNTATDKSGKIMPLSGVSSAALIGKVKEINQRRAIRGEKPLVVYDVTGVQRGMFRDTPARPKKVLQATDEYPLVISIEVEDTSPVGSVNVTRELLPPTAPTVPSTLGGGWKWKGGGR